MQLADLHDQANLDRVASAIARAVSMSYLDEDIGGTQTADETKRRTQLCTEYFKIMRHDMNWSIAKICDLMPRVLFAAMMGEADKYIESMNKRAWARPVEYRTPAGLIIPN